MTALGRRPLASKRLKYVVALRRSRVEGTQDDRPYIGLENIEPSTGRLIRDSEATDQPAPSAAGGAESLSNTFELGDVLFGKLRPYLAKAWVAAFPGRCTTELLVMQPVETESRFLRYVCLSRDFIDAVDASTFGSKMPRADWDFIGNMAVPIPLIPQQCAISDYLDRETARLDALVTAKERVLALLAEKRRALITRAVTRGLNDRIAPVMRLRFLLDCIDTGFTPQSHNVAAQEGQCGVLKSGCVNRGIFNSAENKLLADEVEPPPELEVRPGDVLMSRASGSMELIGSVALVREQPVAKLYLSDKTFRLRVTISKCEPEFLVFAMGSAFLRNQIEQGISGAEGLANNIAQSDIREFLMPVPPLPEQRAVVVYIARETAKLDRLRAATECTIALLKERRAALIAAAVTGKIDVEEAVA